VAFMQSERVDQLGRREKVGVHAIEPTAPAGHH
jgi:hypothetical protein